MKILVVHNDYIHRGGEELCVDREVETLRGAGLQVLEFRPSNGSQTHAYYSALAAPFGGGAEGDFEKLIKTEKPDLLHAHNLFPLLSPRIFKIAKTLKVKTVLTLHNYRPLCLNGLFRTPSGDICERCAPGSYWPGIVRGCYRGSHLQSAGLAGHLRLNRTAYDAVDLFIAPSRFLRDKFIYYGFSPEKIMEHGHFIPEMPSNLPEKAEPYVLYLGRLSEEKGVSWLLSVFRSPKVLLKLKVAGDGPLEKEVRRASEESNSIDYVGYVTGNDKNNLLRHAAALIVPSECYENFPLAIPEANVWGVPVIAADMGGLHSLIDSGVNGFLYAPRNTEAFWAALQKIVPTRETYSLREKIQHYARGQFSKENFLQKRLSLYKSLVGSPSPCVPSKGTV